VTQQRKTRVAVVFGGRSTEHPVSCLGAGNVLGAIDRDRYEVVPVGITTTGQWVLTRDDPARLAITDGRMPSVESVAAEPGAAGEPGTPAARPGTRPPGLVVTGPSQVPDVLGSVDVVLPLLHGAYGEDGTIQGMLDLAGIRYAGAGVLASAAGMDKEFMKLIFAARGLPVGPYVVVRDRDWRAAPAGEPRTSAMTERKPVVDEITELGWPVFVKPARGGSSIGTSKAADIGELYDAVEAAREHDAKVIVEAAITGMEIECAVLEGLDGGPPDTSVPGQVRVNGGEDFYDFEAKYLDATTDMVIPAPVPGPAASEVRRLAAAAFEAVGCEGLARVDFFYTPGGQVIVNEINTMPGVTPGSGFPLMWEATGLPLPQLVDRVLQTALRKPAGLH
jgi:D-alanine-D-alanine ligase